MEKMGGGIEKSREIEKQGNTKYRKGNREMGKSGQQRKQENREIGENSENRDMELKENREKGSQKSQRK